MSFAPRPRLAIRFAWLALALLPAAAARAADDAPAALHQQLAPLRQPAVAHQSLPFNYAGGTPEARLASPTLTAVKHGLRDWLEAQLATLGENADEQELARALNARLRQADLLCQGPGENPTDRCASGTDYNGIGFIDPVQIERQQDGRILLVRTGVGILCGSDDSGYLYEWRGGAWQRFWQSEQDIRPGQRYTPQYLLSVHASTAGMNGGKDRLVLSLGYESWCSSNFYRVFYRLWRTRADDAEPLLLLDESPEAYLGRHEPPIEGSVGDADALVEFTIPSLDSGEHSYEAVRHYAVAGEQVRRIDPVALRPRSFVEEWLNAGWSESDAWSATGRKAALQLWHRRIHGGEYIHGDYINDTLRCNRDGTLWQVGVDFDSPLNRKLWFTMRWLPPYHFEMLEIQPQRQQGCQASPSADGEASLFPIQDWR